MLHANRLVSVAQLIVATWGATPPSTAKAQVQSEVWALRRTFQLADIANPITTLPGGYLLDLGPDGLDLGAYTEQVARARADDAEGHPERARKLLRDALSLWKGPALFAENDDVPDPLVHELTACVDVAEQRGLTVSLAVSGETLPVPTTARRELTAPVITALSTARSTARVSLLRTDEEVRVAVVADARISDAITSGSHGVEGTWSAYGEQMRMEARFHR